MEKKKLKYTQTNFCSSLGETETNKQIDDAFSVWQSVCGLKFKRVEQPKGAEALDEDNCEIRTTFLNNHDNQINSHYK